MLKSDTFLEVAKNLESTLGEPTVFALEMVDDTVIVGAFEKAPIHIGDFTIKWAMSQLCALADDHFVKLFANNELVSMIQNYGLEIQHFGFNNGGIRLPNKLLDGTLVYVAEVGAAPFMESQTVHRRKIVNLLGESNSDPFVTLSDTERGLKRVLREFQQLTKTYFNSASSESEPVDSHLFKTRRYKNYRMLGNSFHAEEVKCEASYTLLITICGMLIDRICNLAFALNLASENSVWKDIDVSSTGKKITNIQSRRTHIRNALLTLYSDRAVLERLLELRHDITHARFCYIFPELDLKDVLISPTYQLETVALGDSGTIRATELNKDVIHLVDKFLVWFLETSETQISP